MSKLTEDGTGILVMPMQITKLEYFALHALVGISSVCDADGFMQTDAVMTAERAFAYAKAMLAESARVQGE